MAFVVDKHNCRVLVASCCKGELGSLSVLPAPRASGFPWSGVTQGDQPRRSRG
jgi:hypothetical protein